MQDAITLPAGSVSARALSAAQKEGWDRDGYLILPQFLGADVVDPVNALIERLSNPGARQSELAGRGVDLHELGEAARQQVQDERRRQQRPGDVNDELYQVCPDDRLDPAQ